MEFLNRDDPRTEEICKTTRPILTIEVRYLPGQLNEGDFLTIFTWAPEVSKADPMPIVGMAAGLLTVMKGVQVCVNTIQETLMARGLAVNPPPIPSLPILTSTAKVPGKDPN